MSTRFQKSIIMPQGNLGHVTLLRLPRDDFESVLRWHRKEWEQFRLEVRAYQSKVYAAIHDAAMRGRFGSPHKQRGTIQMAGFGVQMGGAGETVTLSGTSGSPNSSTDKEDTPSNAVAGWRFETGGDVRRVVGDVWTLFNVGTEWIDSGPVGNYWIQASLFSGDTPNFQNPGLDSFLALSLQREWSWIENSDPPGFATTTGIVEVDISSESDGTPILDTGFYRGTASQNGTA